jgi:hypothetical protein
MSLVSIWFTGREAGDRLAFVREGGTFYNRLKIRNLLSLTNWPLNSI